MIHIQSITLREIRLPLREPFIISSGAQHLRRILLVELIDADGHTSWSECVAQELPNYSCETIDTARHAMTEWLIPILLKRDLEPTDVAGLLDRHVRGHRMAKATLEMGAWALQAEKLDAPLCRLLGGTREQVEVGISIGLQETSDELVDKARRYLAEGYRKIKMKIKPGFDVDYLTPVREALGDAALAADANAAYGINDLSVLLAIDELGLTMLEQPLQYDDLVRHAKLQKEMKTPICLDESITGLERTEDMIELGAARIVNIKPGRVGGFAPSRAIHDVCAAQNVPVWCGGMLESGIGRAHNVALASLPNFCLPGDLSPSLRYWERDIVTPEWTMSTDGLVDVPHDKPGLGVVVDRDRIDELTVRIDTAGA